MKNNIEVVGMSNSEEGEDGSFIWIYDRLDNLIKRVPYVCVCEQAHVLCVEHVKKDFLLN